MKTKHLFFAAALMSSFASCTNENIISDDMQNAAGTRPVVGNVKLNFSANDAQTRVIYNKGYQWEASDEIGALLMDNVNDLSKPWGDRYTLTEYIHTAFPFTYDKNAKTWGCESKMLEGNYFFAWPWEDYDGNRKVIHSLKAQKQTGVSPDVRQESYADNQFFVGYSQIKAANTNGDILGTVDMTPILGALQFQITNVGTKTYHINKIVLSSGATDKIWSEMTINPTTAAYDTDSEFNYAKYVGEAVTGADYTKNGALRALVTNIGLENSAELTIDGSPEERELKSDNGKSVAYALIMCNPIKTVSTGDLMLSIYTEEGMVSNIDLSERYTGGAGKYGIVTSSVVKSVGPDVVNTIGIQVDDNSFTVPTEMNIYNASDLYQFIYWNDNIAGTREITANLKKNLTLDSKTIALLEGSDNVTLTIMGNNNTITLAKDVDADFLNSEAWKLATTSELNIEVTNALTLTKDSKAVKSITVAGDDVATEEVDPAVLTIETADAVVPATIHNYGKVTMGTDAVVAAGKTINNYKDGVVKLAVGGESKATIENAFGATVDNNGYMLNVNNAGVVNVGSGATLGVTNDEGGKVVTVANAIVKGTNKNKAEIEFVTGADLTGVNNEDGGIVSTEYTGSTIDDKTFKSPINKVIIKANTTINKTVTIPTIEVAGTGVTVTVYKDNSRTETLNVTTLKLVGGKITTNGKINVGEFEAEKEIANGSSTPRAYTGALTVEKGTSWYNNGTVVVSGKLVNGGVIYNNSNAITAAEREGADARYNGISKDWPNHKNPGTDYTKYNRLLKDFVIEYMNHPADAYKKGVEEGTYDTYAVKFENVENCFTWWLTQDLTSAGSIAAVALKAEMGNVGKTSFKNELATALASITGDADAEEALKAALDAFEFNASAPVMEQFDFVDKIEVTNPDGTITTTTGKQIAVDAFKHEILSKGLYNIAGKNYITNSEWTTYVSSTLNYAELAAVIGLLSDDSDFIADYLHKHRAVVYAGCKVETPLKLWIKYRGLTGYGDFIAGSSNGNDLYNWAKKILNADASVAPMVKTAQQELINAGYTTVPSLDQFKGYTVTQLRTLYASF